MCDKTFTFDIVPARVSVGRGAPRRAPPCPAVPRRALPCPGAPHRAPARISHYLTGLIDKLLLDHVGLPPVLDFAVHLVIFLARWVGETLLLLALFY